MLYIFKKDQFICTQFQKLAYLISPKEAKWKLFCVGSSAKKGREIVHTTVQKRFGIITYDKYGAPLLSSESSQFLSPSLSTTSTNSIYIAAVLDGIPNMKGFGIDLLEFADFERFKLQVVQHLFPAEQAHLAAKSPQYRSLCAASTFSAKEAAFKSIGSIIRNYPELHDVTFPDLEIRWQNSRQGTATLHGARTLPPHYCVTVACNCFDDTICTMAVCNFVNDNY